MLIYGLKSAKKAEPECHLVKVDSAGADYFWFPFAQ